jgi:hypothetical protein
MFKLTEFNYGRMEDLGTFATIEEAMAAIPGVIVDAEEDADLPGFYNVLTAQRGSARHFIITPMN